MGSPKSVSFRNKLAVLARGKWIYVIMLPGIIWYALLAYSNPETNNLAHDGCYFVYWLFFLLAGFICITQPLLMDSLERNRRFALRIAFLSLILLDYLRWNKIEPGYEQWPFGGESFVGAFLALKAIVAWSWVLALVGYGKKYLNYKHKILGYLNQAVYPFYILHQTVIVVLAYYIVQTPNESILSKYIYTVGITFFLTAGIYHLLVRPYALTRFLFGMKPKDEKKPAQTSQVEKLNEVVMLSP
jgi:peptidoglycan/LPS O-acetylase OafA/YrhL